MDKIEKMVADQVYGAAKSGLLIKVLITPH